MEKKIKRILVVFLLLLSIVLVGWLCFTSKRFTGYPQDLSVYQKTSHQIEDGCSEILKLILQGEL